MVTKDLEIENAEITPEDLEQLKKDKPWKVEDCGDIFPGAISPLGNYDDDTAEFELRVDKAFTVGATGHKRNGKSLFLTRAGVVALTMGLPVWSNYPIEFNYIVDGHSKHMKSNPLDWKALYTFDESLEYGVVIISEIQQWLDNRSSMRLNNRLFSYILRQIGKRHLSLWYDCFSLDTIDRRLPAETDVEVKCEDLRKTFWGKTKGTHIEEGEYIKLTCFALSNAWLGFTSRDSGIIPEYTLYGKPYWKCYDTGYMFDPFEAMAGIQLDLQKTVITNKPEKTTSKEPQLRKTIESLLQKGITEISPTELWGISNISTGESSFYGGLIKQMGLIKRRRLSGYVYSLADYKD